MNQERLFYILNIANWIVSASMSVIVPFFPPFAKEQGLDSFLIGLIFSFHPLGGVVGSFYIGSLLNNKNRIIIILLSTLLECLVMILFLVQYFIQGYYFIIITGLLARFLNGFAYSMLVTAFYSLIPQLFPKNKEQKLAAAETASAMGYVLGPIFGSFLYNIGGYAMPFLIQALMAFGCGFFIYSIKSDIRLESEQQLELIELQDLTCGSGEFIISQYEELSLKVAIGNPRVILNGIMAAFTHTMICYQFPILALYLQQQFGVTAEYIGNYMFVHPLSYSFSSILLTFIRNPKKKNYIFFAQIVHSMAQFYYGPDSHFTGLSQNIMIFMMAQFIGGFAASPGGVYCLPLMSEILLKQYPKEEELVTNLCTSIFTAGCFIGDFIGPLISGFLNNYTDYSRIASIFGICSFVLTGCYYKIMFNK